MPNAKYQKNTMFSLLSSSSKSIFPEFSRKSSVSAYSAKFSAICSKDEEKEIAPVPLDGKEKFISNLGGFLTLPFALSGLGWRYVPQNHKGVLTVFGKYQKTSPN